MKAFVALVFAAFATTASAQSSCDQFLAYGYPTVTQQDTTRLCRITYVVEHDNAKKVPAYSAELLLAKNFNSKNKRVNAFKADPDLRVGKRAELSDYDKAYDRGHMTPFEDAKFNSAAALQTFYLSNMVPQDLHLNRGLWRAIENRTRSYASNAQAGVYVITGPVFQGKYSTIGNGVAVPTHVFKVIIDKSTNQGVAYLVPNKGPGQGDTPDTFKTSISEVEKVTGYNFTPTSKDPTFKSVIGEEFK